MDTDASAVHGTDQSRPKIVEAVDRWLWHPHEIEHDLEAYTKHTIGDWFSGELSSRRFLVLIDGLVADSRSTGGWYGNAIRADWEEKREDEAIKAEKAIRAVNKAEITGQPLMMEDME